MQSTSGTEPSAVGKKLQCIIPLNDHFSHFLLNHSEFSRRILQHCGLRLPGKICIPGRILPGKPRQDLWPGRTSIGNCVGNLSCSTLKGRLKFWLSLEGCEPFGVSSIRCVCRISRARKRAIIFALSSRRTSLQLDHSRHNAAAEVFSGVLKIEHSVWSRSVGSSTMIVKCPAGGMPLSGETAHLDDEKWSCSGCRICGMGGGSGFLPVGG
jgi:hypothetical protein